MTIQRKQQTLPASKAAKNSDSVELQAVSDCVFDLQKTAPPQKVKTRPVVERRRQRSLACAASTNPISVGRLMSIESANPLSSGILYHSDGSKSG